MSAHYHKSHYHVHIILNLLFPCIIPLYNFAYLQIVVIYQVTHIVT